MKGTAVGWAIVSKRESYKNVALSILRGYEPYEFKEDAREDAKANGRGERVVRVTVTVGGR